MNGFSPQYIRSAIQNEADRVANSVPSTRNDTLNGAAFNLASLGVSGSDIIHSLRPAALRSGLKNGEIYSTINSGMRAGRQHRRLPPAGAYTRHRNSPSRLVRLCPTVEDRADRSENLTASSLPNCDAQDKFKVGGNDGPLTLDGELRRHVYRRAGRAVRVKVKLARDGDIRFQNWYAVIRDDAAGWQAQKPAEYVAVPYVGGLDPFDSEITDDTLVWPEGEKDVDTLTWHGVPAFTFGGTGDGLPVEAARHLKGRHVVILADNDDGGRAHAEKKAALAYGASAASVRVVHFPELPPKADVSDFFQAGGLVEELYARIDATPGWVPTADEAATSESDGLVARSAADIRPKKVDWAWPNRIALGKHSMIGGEGGLSKSQFLAFLAATISTAGVWPADEGTAPLGNVIMFSAGRPYTGGDRDNGHKGDVENESNQALAKPYEPTPYEPTPYERRVKEAYLARRKEKPRAPRIKISENDGVMMLALDHQDPSIAQFHLLEALGGTDPDFLEGFLKQLCIANSHDRSVDEDGLNFMLSIVKGIEPRDPVEAMLAAQMAVTHNATMTFARRLNHVETIPQQDSAERAFNKLARTFAAQVEALKRYRSVGEQTMRVGQVTVSEGGQAIVGNVASGGRGASEKTEPTS
jgi:hypothetical protein